MFNIIARKTLMEYCKKYPNAKFQFKTIQIKWFGTHEAYDQIDVLTINPK